MIENEIWKTIPDAINKFGHTYSVSNFGNVRNNNTGRILSKRPNADGYHRATVGEKEYRVHRLVALMFVENDNPAHKPEVNHIDLNKENNHYSNLEWCDRQYNMNHAKENGALKDALIGENNGRAMLTEKEVMEIWYNFYDEKYVSEKYGLTVGSARNLLKRKTWKYLIPIFDEMYGKDYYASKLENRINKSDGSHMRKLTDEQALDIYLSVNKNGLSQADMMRKYQISDTMVHSIANVKPKYVKKILNERGIL